MNDLAPPRPREPLPTREEIAAITEESILTEMEAGLEAAREKVEVDLEFATDKGLDWERRARGYLTAVRIAIANVKQRLHRLRTAGRHIPDSEASRRASETKVDRKLAHEAEASNALARKTQQQDAIRIQQAVLNRRLVERLSYLHHFHAAAHEQLSEVDCRRLSSAAAEAVRLAVAETLAVQA